MNRSTWKINTLGLARIRRGLAGCIQRPWPAFTCLRFVLGVCVFALIAALGASCLSQRGGKTAWDTPAENIVWPSPPEQPRIQWVGAIHSAKDIGREGGFGNGIKNVIFGKKDTGFVRPVAVSKNRLGLLAIADPGVPTVHIINLETKKYARLKRKLAALMPSPVGVAVADDGAIYVSDSQSAELFVLNDSGEVVKRFGKGVVERTTGLALNAEQDKLFVVDTMANQVVTFDRSGEKIRAVGGRGKETGQFNFPTFIATTPKGQLCVSDSLNFRLQIISPDGTPVRSLGGAGDGAGSFTRPKGVGCDSLGHIYVVDAAFENVQLFDEQGTFLLAFGSSGKGPGEFCLPAGLFVDANNLIWVADMFNHRVLVFRLMENAV